MKTIFKTSSGSQYVIENNRLTRLSEIPIISARTRMAVDTIVMGQEIIWQDGPPTVGSRFICTLLNDGPLSTTHVTEVTNDI